MILQRLAVQLVACWTRRSAVSHELCISNMLLASGAEVVGVHADPAEEAQAKGHETPHSMRPASRLSV